MPRKNHRSALFFGAAIGALRGRASGEAAMSSSPYRCRSSEWWLTGSRCGQVTPSTVGWCEFCLVARLVHDLIERPWRLQGWSIIKPAWSGPVVPGGPIQHSLKRVEFRADPSHAAILEVRHVLEQALADSVPIRGATRC